MLFIAFLGGLLPSLLWLFFWLLEDRCQPEPKRYILLTFLAGMLAVLVVLPIEKAAMMYWTGAPLLLAWAIAEEVLKVVAAAFALRSRMFDEPIDAVIYMVTAALGFAAAENALFLLGPLSSGDVLKSIISQDLRFIGATLLHTLASATVGYAIALTYFKPRIVRARALGLGLILAVALHTVFNFFILNNSDTAFTVFVCTWAGIITILFCIERIKNPAKNYC